MRTLVAACAACISTVCVHPIDTMYVSKQLQSERRLRHPMAGSTQAAVSAFVLHGTYIAAYEFGLERAQHAALRVPIAACLGSVVVSIIGTPLSIAKKRRQVIQNKMHVPKPLGAMQTARLMCITFIGKYPKTCLKYGIYEHILRVGIGEGALLGMLAGFVASTVAATIFEPVELIRTYNTLGLSTRTDRPFNGLGYGILSSVLANTLAGGILEAFAPRSITF